MEQRKFNPPQCKTDRKLDVIKDGKLGWCNRNGDGDSCAYRGIKYGGGVFCNIELHKGESIIKEEKRE